jgi:hypothetical protein
MDRATVRLSATSADQDVGEALAALGVDDPEVMRQERRVAAAEPQLLAALAENPEQVAASANDPWTVAKRLVGGLRGISESANSEFLIVRSCAKTSSAPVGLTGSYGVWLGRLAPFRALRGGA